MTSKTAKPTAANGNARPIIPKTRIVPNVLFAAFALIDPDRSVALGKNFQPIWLDKFVYLLEPGATL